MRSLAPPLGARSPGVRRTPSQRGFTLLEILVVVVIIGILATFAVLAIGNRSLDDRLDVEARRLSQLLSLAVDETEIKGIEMGMLVAADGYLFLGLTPEGVWTPQDDTGIFRSRGIQDPFYLELRVDGRLVAPRDADEKKVEPQVFLLSSGERSVFSVDVRARGYEPYYRIDVDALGRIRMERFGGDRA